MGRLVARPFVVVLEWEMSRKFAFQPLLTALSSSFVAFSRVFLSYLLGQALSFPCPSAATALPVSCHTRIVAFLLFSFLAIFASCRKRGILPIKIPSMCFCSDNKRDRPEIGVA